ncbi:hypothetical protein, partial [Acinetobacter bereziniae]|uniref:hypothetical protein n=1 Tax=Acinetobacter bereziniae TaxID=106648 RepID=UPI001C078138
MLKQLLIHIKLCESKHFKNQDLTWVFILNQLYYFNFLYSQSLNENNDHLYLRNIYFVLSFPKLKLSAYIIIVKSSFTMSNCQAYTGARLAKKGAS